MTNAKRVAGNTLYALLACVPSACFTGAFITDVAYWESANMQWANFSVWLLTVGLLIAVFAVLVGVADFLMDRRIGAPKTAIAYAAGNATAIGLAIVNAFVHSRDAWTSVVPDGLILSALTVLVLLFTGWMGWDLVWQSRVAEQR